jgi:hypothetical protein
MAVSTRKTLQELRSSLVGGALAGISMVIVDPKKLSFACEVTYTPQGGVSTTTNIANNNGKVKRYSDVDSAIKDAMSIAPGITEIELGSIDTSALVKPTPTNPVAAAKSEVRRLVTLLNTLSVAKVKANAEIANLQSFQTGSATQQDIYGNAVAARDAIVAGETAANARKTTLDAFVAANGG